MLIHPYISRELARDRQRACSRTPSGCMPSGGCTPNPEQPGTVSSPGSACAVPCAQPLACARHPRPDTPQPALASLRPGRPRATDRGMNPAPDHRDGPAARHSLGEPDHDR